MQPGVTKLDSRLFMNCTALTSASLPEGLTTIGIGAFEYCSSLKDIRLPSTLTELGDQAFYNCTALERIEIPVGVTVLENWTFYGCESLRQVTLPDKMTKIGDHAFYNCKSLESIKLPQRLLTIGKRSFLGCSSLKSLELPEQCIDLGADALWGCTSLSYIKFGSLINTVGLDNWVRDYGYSNRPVLFPLSALTRIEVDPESMSLSVVDGVLMNADLTKTVTACRDVERVVLPAAMLRIGWYTFNDCTRLQEVCIPKGLKDIDTNAFKNCTALTAIRYEGSREDWESIDMADWDREALTPLVIYDQTHPNGPEPPDHNYGTGPIVPPEDVTPSQPETDGPEPTGPSGPAVTALRFDDVPESHWGYKSIMTIAGQGLVTGTRAPGADGVGSFSPDGKVTLGQFLVVITRLVCPDKRVDYDFHWAAGSYAAAMNTGIINTQDFSTDASALDEPLTREDMALILVNAAEYKNMGLLIPQGTQVRITDFERISDRRRTPVIQCYVNGILSGYGDGSFGPKNTMTRAEMAVVVCRLAGWQPRAEVTM